MVWKGVEEDLASEEDIQKARDAAANAMNASPQNVAATLRRTAGR